MAAKSGGGKKRAKNARDRKRRDRDDGAEGQVEIERQNKTDPAAGGRPAKRGKARGRGQARAEDRDEGGGVQRSRESQRGGRRRPRGAAATLAESIREHPVAAAAVGAGLGLLLAQSARLAWSSAALEALREEVEERGLGEILRERAEVLRDGATTLGRYGREGLSRAGEAIEYGAEAVGEAAQRSAEAIRRGASAVGEVTYEGYECGREFAVENWQNHPLVMCATALALGAAAGLLLPSLPAEAAAMGAASARAAERLRDTGQQLLEQGKELVTKAVTEAAAKTVREAERAGLTPEQIGRKVKHIAGSVRKTVADAVQ